MAINNLIDKDELTKFLFIINVFLATISITSIILSGIGFDQSKDNDNTYVTNNNTNILINTTNYNVTNYEWIQYNFSSYMIIPETETPIAPINIKFMTDNSSIVYFVISSGSFECLNESIFYIKSNTSIPDFLIAKNNNYENINTGVNSLTGYKGGSIYLQGFSYFLNDGSIYLQSDINLQIAWNNSSLTCVWNSSAGSYLLNTTT